MACAVLGCAPIHPLAVLTLPLCVWVLAIIDTPLAKKIFRKAEEERITRQVGHNSWVRIAWFGTLWLFCILGGAALIFFAIYQASAPNYQPKPLETKVTVTDSAQASATATPESEILPESTAAESESTTLEPNDSTGIWKPVQVANNWRISIFGIVVVVGVLVLVAGLTLVAVVVYFVFRRRKRA